MQHLVITYLVFWLILSTYMGLMAVRGNRLSRRLQALDGLHEQSGEMPAPRASVRAAS